MFDSEDKRNWVANLTMDYDCSMSLNVISWNATNQVVIFRYEREIQFLLFTTFSENPLEK